MDNLTIKDLNDLKSKDNIDFVVIQNKIVKKLKDEPNYLSILENALFNIAESELPLTEKCRRASLLLQKSSLTIEDFEFFEKIFSLPSEIKSGISHSLPINCLPLLFKVIDKGQKKIDLPDNSSDEVKYSIGNVLEESFSSIPQKDSIVILLSTLDNQESNISLLNSNGFPAFRLSTEEELETNLKSQDIGGIVIDKSFWIGKDPTQQNSVLTKVTKYSTISCLLIDRTDFHAPAKIIEIVKTICVRSLESDRFLLRDNSNISDADIPCFEKSDKLLSRKFHPQFILSDFSETETIALIASATAFYQEESANSSRLLTSLQIKMLQGGRSSEKVAAVSFDKQGLPSIAKIGKRDSIMNELTRFKTFVNIHDNTLKPYVHFHCDIGVIIWGSICNPSVPSNLAPTLESQIKKVCSAEIWGLVSGDLDIPIQCKNLVNVIERVSNKLVSINSQKSLSKHKSFESYAYLRGSSLKYMEEQGINYNLPLLGDKKITEYINKAHSIIEPHSKKAIVHGDINLRNILVRDNTDAYIIDYDTIGPGHPAYDLVRLECSLILQFLRSLGTEDDFVKFQRSFSIDFDSFEALKSKSPIWFSSSINQALIQSAIICRDKCLKILEGFSLGKKDYIATKFTICCYSVAVPGLQWCFIRGTISALASEL